MGVIDKAGNIVIEPKFMAVQIPNPSKPIFICVNNYNQDTKEYETIVYNEKNEVLLEKYKNVQAIPIYTNITAVPYEKSALTYKKEGEGYGLITLEGKEITKPIYDEISSMNYKEGTFLVKQNGKCGVVNMNGKVIIKPEYEDITTDNYYNETTKYKTTGFIVTKKTEDGFRYGYVNYRGQVILNTEYTELERITQIPDEKELYFIAFKNGQAGVLKNKDVVLNYEYEDIQYHSVNELFIVKRNGKKGAIAKDGKNILHPEYDDILFGGIYLNAVKSNKNYIFDLQGNKIETEQISMTKTENPNYYIAIDKNDIYTIVDANGNILIDDNYTYIEYISGNYFIVAKDGKNGIIDSTGKFVVDLKYTSIFRFNNTNLLQAEISENRVIELYNMQMQKVASMEQAKIEQHDPSSINPNGYIALISANNIAYYDENGNSLEAKDIFPNFTLYAKKQNNKWGFVDKNGNTKVDYKYEMVTEFNEYGFAGIKENGKWGVINQNGEIVQEPIFEIDWILPSFLGKYYYVNTGSEDIIYSSDKIVNEEM